ncbi:MAG: hypothetical protein QM673_14050 [Gordonia sp. (in: high G+C Gram-positive bacteria)]
MSAPSTSAPHSPASHPPNYAASAGEAPVYASGAPGSARTPASLKNTIIAGGIGLAVGFGLLGFGAGYFVGHDSSNQQNSFQHGPGGMNGGPGMNGQGGQPGQGGFAGQPGQGGLGGQSGQSGFGGQPGQSGFGGQTGQGGFGGQSGQSGQSSQSGQTGQTSTN